MIEITCECGRKLEFDDDFAGRRIQCSQCGRPLDLPANADVFDFAEDEMHEQLEWLREKTQSQASNPGMLRVNYLRYAMAFPKPVIIWHGLLLASIALTILVHWAFVFLVAFFLFCIWVYWRRAKYRFIGGCVNPARVISLDPPMIGVLTDLTKGGGECPVVKIMRHPLGRMSTGPPKIGQELATISVYQSLNDELIHWDNFFPIVINLVTADMREIERIEQSIESDDWKELETAMEQVPQPYTPGIYRIYSPEDWQTPSAPDGQEVAEIVAAALSQHSKNYCHSAIVGIPPEELQKARGYIGKVSAESVLAILESFQLSKGAETGMAITARGIFYNYPEVGSGAFAWNELAGAFFDEEVLELTMRTGQRLRIPASHFRSAARADIEEMLNSATLA